MQKHGSLSQVALFNQLPDEALAEVEAVLKPRYLSAGEVLFNQGDAGDELVIVDKGRISIFVPTPGAPESGEPIRIFSPGEVLGEMALLDHKPRSVSARAEESSTILTLKGEDFLRILNHSPDMALLVMSVLSERVRYTTDFLGEVRGWVQRIAEGNYQIPELTEGIQYRDQSMATLAAEFAQMAGRVREREDTLIREVAQLRIEIDQANRKKESERIMSSDYYKKLKERAELLRKRDE